jgi:hypothetical protein
MERGSLGILGTGLVVLCWIGIATRGPMWLAWLDGAVGLWSLLVAGAVMGIGMTRRDSAAGWSIAIATALLTMWVLGFLGGARGWLLWWTLGFSLAYLFVGVFFDLRSCGRRARA